MLMQSLTGRLSFLMFQVAKIGCLPGAVIVYLNYFFGATPLVLNGLTTPFE